MSSTKLSAIVSFIMMCSIHPVAAPLTPIGLHPENPHYFIFRTKPTVLITSGEHYGSVINLDFNYIPYLDALRARDFNYTRICTGPYIEYPGWFNIHNNNQAPAAGRLLCPWARSSTAGYINGGCKFDLTQWDPAFFKRLRDFVEQASLRGVVVEVSLFCPYYNEELWDYSPFKSRNNVNAIGTVTSAQANTMANGNLLPIQEAYVKKIVTELNPCDNVFFEICNEPYLSGPTLDWQAHIADIISTTEASLPNRHLVAQNIANNSEVIKNPNPKVSIFNFHYCRPPDAVPWNYALGKVIGFDETGIDGSADTTYRTQGWDFMIAGGGLYNNLDYSFTVKNPDGTVLNDAPGGGSPALRSQLTILKHFLEGFDFIHLAPDGGTISGGVPEHATVRVLSTRGKAYAIYVHGGTQANLVALLPAGAYQAEWINPKTGKIDKTDTVRSNGSDTLLASPAYTEDIALRLTAKVP